MRIAKIRMAGYSGRELFLLGVGGGLIAGIALIIAEMIISLASGRPLFDPLRLLASITLGSQALDPRYSLVNAGATGLFLQAILSTLYGLIFVYLLAIKGRLDVATGWLLIYGAFFGMVLWVLNYGIVAPLIFEQRTLIDPFWHGFIAHTVGYGAMLGAYLMKMRPQHSLFEAALEEVLRI